MSRRHATDTEVSEADGNGTQAIAVVRPPISRNEAVRRIGLALDKLASDDERQRVIEILTLMHGA